MLDWDCWFEETTLLFAAVTAIKMMVMVFRPGWFQYHLRMSDLTMVSRISGFWLSAIHLGCYEDDFQGESSSFVRLSLADVTVGLSYGGLDLCGCHDGDNHTLELRVF